MFLRVAHETRYGYDAPLMRGLERLRLRPLPWHGQRVGAWDVAIEGGRVEAAFHDAFGNMNELVVTEPGITGLVIRVSGVVETLRGDGVVGAHVGPPLWLHRRRTPLTRAGDGARRLLEGAEPTLAGLHALCARIVEAVPYRIGGTTSATDAEAAIGAGVGVCQDHAHIFLACARALGLPARYVAGYLRMDDRDDQEAGHAWAEAHLDGLGWVGFDVSNGHSPDERYVRVSVGLDARDAAPVTGLAFGTARETLDVSVQVAQVQQ